MDYGSFFKLIKSGGLSGAYLLCGKEEFVKDSALTQVRDSFDEASRAMNISDLTDSKAEALIKACDTLPFFAGKRLVIVKKLPDKDEAEALIEYLPTIPESTLLLFFVRGAVEPQSGYDPKAKKISTKGASPLISYLKAQDRLVDFDTLSESNLVKWIAKTAADAGSIIREGAAQRLIGLVGSDLSNINNELKKAIFYCGQGSEITTDAIDKCVTPNIEYKVFDMLDYFVLNKPGDGMRALKAMLKDGEEPIGIASYVLGRLKLMLRGRIMQDKKIPCNDVIKRLGGNPYATGKALDAARRFSPAQLAKAIKPFADMQYKIFTGIALPDTALEYALINIATLQNQLSIS